MATKATGLHKTGEESRSVSLDRPNMFAGRGAKYLIVQVGGAVA